MEDVQFRRGEPRQPASPDINGHRLSAFTAAGSDPHILPKGEGSPQGIYRAHGLKGAAIGQGDPVHCGQGRNWISKADVCLFIPNYGPLLFKCDNDR